MRATPSRKHRWLFAIGLLPCISPADAAFAQASPRLPVQPVAPNGVVLPLAQTAQLAIGSPLPGSLVAGRISFALSYQAGMSRINAFTVYVDDTIQYSRSFLGINTRGIQYLELDTRTLADGNHTVKIAAIGARGLMGVDSVDIVVRNGVAGGPDLVPPLLQFRGLLDGDTVSGKLPLDLLAEDNTTVDLLVSIFVNQQLRMLSNRPPYSLELNTSEFLDPATGTGRIRLEAWAFDRAMNRGMARPITLNVVPPGAGNPTPKQEDPTRPLTAKTDAPAADPKSGLTPVQEPMGGQPTFETTIRARVPLPGAAKPAPAKRPPARLAGVKSSAVRRSAPPIVARPAAPRMVENPSGGYKQLIIPLPAGPALGASRAATPAIPPTAPRVVEDRPATVDMPEPVRLDMPLNGRPAAAGTRALTPAARPVGGPFRMAAAKVEPRRPEVKGPAASAGAALPPAAAPLVKPVLTPEKPAAAAPKSAAPAVKPPSGRALVIVVDPKAKSDEPGKLPAAVYEMTSAKPASRSAASVAAALPRDRSYTVRTGETVGQIARRFRVTPKSILLANGIESPRALRDGSVIKVPGTFDLVLDDRRIAFDVPPRIENGLPLAPFRQIFEHAGGVVIWYPETQEVRAANGQTEIKLNIGSKEALVNRMIVVMDREAFVDTGRTIVPVSFMEKAMDLKAEYDVKSRTIVLVRK